MWEIYLDAMRGISVPVKCPKCGFISFPGHELCKKCGHHFTQVNGPAEGIPPLFHPPAPEEKTSSPAESESALDQTELQEPESGELDVELEPQTPPQEPANPEPEPPPQEPPQGKRLSPWQSELADRVQEYRQRRARLTEEMENKLKALDLDFGVPAPKPEESKPHVIEFPSGEVSATDRPKPKPEVRSAPPSFGMRSFESAFMEENGKPFDPPSAPIEPPSHADSGPLEIELGSSGDAPIGGGADEASAASIAQMNMRFYAGLIDTLVLLAGAGCYALIFWQVGGKFSFHPLQLAATGLTAAFFVVFYFAGCTALASATPGLMWTGLEVITFEGNQPRISDCLWRGLGYLVSMSALMLGFIWAAVDAEGLTWHDRMSRTFIVPAEGQ
jgi:uncharacterized RDD family membrane protein YckC